MISRRISLRLPPIALSPPAKRSMRTAFGPTSSPFCFGGGNPGPAAKGAEITAAQQTSLKNIRLVTTGPLPVIYIENSSDLLFDSIKYDPGSATLFSINGDKCANIRVEHTDATKATRSATFNYGAKELNFTIVGGANH